MKETVNKKVALPNTVKDLDLRPMFPNMITMSALASGLTSLQFAFWGNWPMAVICIALAALCDGLDGRVARMLGVSSKFGAELDSLSDLVCFGVAPGFLLYRWTMVAEAVDLIGGKVREAIGVPWALALFLALCCALRLARFNTMLDEKQPPYWTHFFTGLPAPGGAYVALFPLILNLWTKAEFLRNPWIVGFFLLFSAILMASRIPTPCFKKIHLPKVDADKGSIISMITALCVSCLFVLLWYNFWGVVSIVGVIYLIMLPLGILYFIKQKKLYLEGKAK
ncbi:MAG: CDP-alcohol phosphatidyltransferase family protein [Alphaproteobacteria bacterium]